MAEFKSMLTPEGSIVAGLAVAGLVVAVYEHQLGSVASVHNTDAAHPATKSAVRTAGWESLGLVAAVALLARDPNIMILGAAVIIAEDVRYKHAIMASPDTGMLQVSPASYASASQQAGAQVVPFSSASSYSG